MSNTTKNIAKWDYEPPLLTEINLLDESVRGFSEEPPDPSPPNPDAAGDQFERDIEDALGI